MAEPEVPNVESNGMTNLTELKEELMIPDDDVAARNLNALKELKSKKSSNDTVIPEEFKCPISRELMADPVVVVTTGETYDRAFIQKRLLQTTQICPQSNQILSHTNYLTPNKLVREMILRWCEERGIEPPNPVQNMDGTDDGGIGEPGYFNSLLETISSPSSSPDDWKEAAKELRLLTQRKELRLLTRTKMIRAIFRECSDTISKLLNPLSIGNVDALPDLQENLMATLYNISLHKKNRRLLAENSIVMPLLIQSLYSGTDKTMASAAGALFNLSKCKSNRQLMGKKDVIPALIELIDEGPDMAMKDAVYAIYKLCENEENRKVAVKFGVVRVFLKKAVAGHGLGRVLMDILRLLLDQSKAVEEMRELDDLIRLHNQSWKQGGDSEPYTV